MFGGKNMKNNFNGEEKIWKMVSLTKKLYKKQPSSSDVEEFVDFVLENLVEEKEDKSYFFFYIIGSRTCLQGWGWCLYILSDECALAYKFDRIY